MTTSPSSTVGCPIIAEFEDDASKCTPVEPEYVSLPVAGPEAAGQPLFAPPRAEAAAAAKKFWLKILRRFTESVPGKKGRLRVADAAAPDEGRIVVECGRPLVGRDREGGELGARAGDEVDFADKYYLVLFGRRLLVLPDGQARLAESSTPVLWTDVVNIRFEVERVVVKRAAGGS